MDVIGPLLKLSGKGDLGSPLRALADNAHVVHDVGGRGHLVGEDGQRVSAADVTAIR